MKRWSVGGRELLAGEFWRESHVKEKSFKIGFRETSDKYQFKRLNCCGVFDVDVEKMVGAISMTEFMSLDRAREKLTRAYTLSASNLTRTSFQ